MILLL
jgi:hypothetical protein